MKDTLKDKNLFRDASDVFQISKNIQDIYMSDSSLCMLIDFERVLDELDIYAFRNWEKGELVSGPVVSKYRVSAIFMWPENMMPDPRGGRRLLPFDCEVTYLKTLMKIPVKINTPDDYRPGTHKARVVKRPVWLVEITIPRRLISEIKTGAIETNGEAFDIKDVEDSYDEGVDGEIYQDQPQQSTPGMPA